MAATSSQRFIQAGGGGIVPQLDAPNSASNAGERVSQTVSFLGFTEY